MIRATDIARRDRVAWWDVIRQGSEARLALPSLGAALLRDRHDETCVAVTDRPPRIVPDGTRRD